MNYLKQPRHDSEAWRRAVASLPCQLCGREGMTQCAHSNHRGKGMAIKSDDAMSAALCITCHRNIPSRLYSVGGLFSLRDACRNCVQ